MAAYGVVRKRTLSWEDPTDSRLDGSESINEIILLDDEEALKRWMIEHKHKGEATIFRLTPVSVELNISIIADGPDPLSPQSYRLEA